MAVTAASAESDSATPQAVVDIDAKKNSVNDKLTHFEESYLAAKTIRTGAAQTIALPPPYNANAPDKVDLDVIRVKVVKSVKKRR